MKIYGPYTAKDGRSRIVKQLDDKSLITISYPRYLMEEALGRKLEDWEEVDHKDGNIRNNELSNLQVLSGIENRRKSVWVDHGRQRKYKTYTCPCGKEFQAEVSQRERQDRQKNKVTKENYCSRKCGGYYSHPSIRGSG